MDHIYVISFHECLDCVIDMLKNISYFDNSSIILIYDGSYDQFLEFHRDELLSYHSRIVFYPNSTHQEWANVHNYVLDCMRYCELNFDYDIITFIDSDQLLLRSGYIDHIRSAVQFYPYWGIYGNCFRIFEYNEDWLKDHNMFKNRYHLIEFLSKYYSLDEIDSNSFYLCFFPSTSYSRKAIRSLISFCDKTNLVEFLDLIDDMCVAIEFIFPTIIALEGYQLISSSSNYVRYRPYLNINDLDNIQRMHPYWLHPVYRDYNDLLRSTLRYYCFNYVK